MKIASIDIYPFPIKMRAPFRIATMVADHAPNVLIAIRTDEGLIGWGEASPLHSITGETQGICIAAARELRPLLLDANPLEISALVDKMDRFLPHNATIKSAFDMALHDIAAQAAGMPLYRYLGGDIRPMETDITLGIGDPAEAGPQAAALLSEGPGILKVKLGVGFAEDVARIASIRDAIGPATRIRIDANQGYDATTAIQVLNALAAYNIEFCEQPVRGHDTAGLKAVSAASPIPVMADEALFHPSDALHIAAERAAPMFNIKLSKSGGIHNALKIAHIAEAAGIPCMVGCMLESRLGLVAAAHFACATRAVRYYDLDTCFEQAENPIDGGIQYDGGSVLIPSANGMGAKPSEETLSRLERM
jgi:L-alanine-DL-glutamate epimerase-like enolase superfamily enzyme